MNKYSTDKIRNIALASHSGTGKTSIVESMLFNSKVITRIGNVEEGNTASDYEQEETKRKTSIQTTVFPFDWNGFKLNVLDTPGYADYVGELKQGIQDLRVGVPKELFFEEVQDQVKERVEEAINLLKRLGASIEEVSFPDVHDATAISSGILGAEATAYHLPWMKERPQDYTTQTLVRLESHLPVPATDYIRAQQGRTRFIHRMREIMQTIDVLVTPTVSTTAPRIGESTKIINGREYPTQLIFNTIVKKLIS